VLKKCAGQVVVGRAEVRVVKEVEEIALEMKSHSLLGVELQKEALLSEPIPKYSSRDFCVRSIIREHTRNNGRRVVGIKIIIRNSEEQAIVRRLLFLKSLAKPERDD
jgi:hypothetical protein